MSNMIVCPEPPAARVGQDIFARGGSAVDAAIATAFAQAVTNPLMCGLGGTGHLYLYAPRGRRHVLLDFEGMVGSVPIPGGWAMDYLGRAETVGRYILRSEANQIGHQSILIPGFVRGCWVAFQRLGSGRVSWPDLLDPAVRLASDGFEIYPYMAAFWRNREAKPGYPSVMAKLHATPEARRIFLKSDGSAYEEGDRFVQPDLARTIQLLADAGGEDFYSGEIGQTMAEDLARHSGLITAEDLRNYSVCDAQLFQGSYRGMAVNSAPEIIEMLHILQHFDLRSLGHNSAEYVDTFARIQRATLADYAQSKGADLGETKRRAQRMTGPERATYWASRINRGDRIALRGGAIDSGTTHLTCVDADRNVVGINHSIGSVAGSGVVTRGLGFLYNNFLGHFSPLPGHPDSIVPQKRLSDIIASIVFRDGEPYIAIGSPGGSRLITSMVQCVVNVIDFGMDMRTAVTVPRFHSEEEQRIYLEPQFPERTAQALRALGNDVQRSTYMARLQAILIRPDTGELEAGADPRGGAGVGCRPLPA